MTVQHNTELNERFEWGWEALGDRELLETLDHVVSRVNRQNTIPIISSGPIKT